VKKAAATKASVKKVAVKKANGVSKKSPKSGSASMRGPVKVSVKKAKVVTKKSLQPKSGSASMRDPGERASPRVKAKEAAEKKNKSKSQKKSEEEEVLSAKDKVPTSLTSKSLAEHDANDGAKRKLRYCDGDASRGMDRLYCPDWEGNSDSRGSVDSACLDENVCYECGESTAGLTTDECKSMILCDRCDGEFHLKCVNLETMPRSSVPWVCPRCLEDERQFKGLGYDIVVRNWKGEKQRVEFKIKKTRKEVGLSFSPARPLQLAWQEFQEKMYMCVSKVFDYDTIKKLTHGTVEARTLTGRVSHSWNGVLNEISSCLKAGVMTNLIHRDGRYDMRLPDFLVQELGLDLKLKPILDKLRTVMGTPAPELRTHNIVFVPVGSSHQRWHADDTLNKLKRERYFTIIIHLNLTDEDGGGTEIWSRKLHRGDLVRGRPGDAFVFSGSLLHRGQGNSGLKHRLFYYASFACRPDANAEYAD
jgi:hypothetical protein